MYDKSTDNYVIAQWLEQHNLATLIMCMLQENHNKSNKKKESGSGYTAAKRAKWEDGSCKVPTPLSLPVTSLSDGATMFNAPLL